MRIATADIVLAAVPPMLNAPLFPVAPGAVPDPVLDGDPTEAPPGPGVPLPPGVVDVFVAEPPIAVALKVAKDFSGVALIEATIPALQWLVWRSRTKEECWRFEW